MSTATNIIDITNMTDADLAYLLAVAAVGDVAEEGVGGHDVALAVAEELLADDDAVEPAYDPIGDLLAGREDAPLGYTLPPARRYEPVAEVDNRCRKCSGWGHIPGYEHIAGGVCFGCNGTGAARTYFGVAV